MPRASNPSAPPETSRQARFPSFLVSMVLVALAIRLVVMVFLLPEQLDPQRDHWHFGYEAGRIARTIVQGRGFSSPLFEDTGPTAWMTPVYPYLVAGVFKLFGIYTKASAIVLLSLNALMSALICILVFRIDQLWRPCRKMVRLGVGLLSLCHLFSRRAHLGDLAGDLAPLRAFPDHAES